MQCMKIPFSIINARIVRPEDVLDNGAVLIEDGIIKGISENSFGWDVPQINAEGSLLIPGFIDVHSDAIEKEIEARPGTYLETRIALFELDKKLASAGVTTMYHSLSFAQEGVILVRSLDIVRNVIREIKRLSGQFCVKTKVHARYEITNSNDLQGIEELAEEGLIDLMSLMDHTPGQGQFKEKEQIYKYYSSRFGIGDKEIEKLVIDRQTFREEVGDKNASEIKEICKRKGIPLASHDDDSAEKVLKMKEYGAVISEFPVNLEAVKTAKDSGTYVALGSPNILRGYSHNNNLSSRDLLINGYGDIVCSDYIPSTLLYALFVLVQKKIFDLPGAVKLFSANPARALGIERETGTIEAGKDADLVLVNDIGELPRIIKTFVRGREVYSVCLE